MSKHWKLKMPKKPKVEKHLIKGVHGTFHRVTYDMWCGMRTQGKGIDGAVQRPHDTTCIKCRNVYMQSLKDEIFSLYKKMDILQKKWHGSPRRKKEKQNDRFEILEFTEE